MADIKCRLSICSVRRWLDEHGFSGDNVWQQDGHTDTQTHRHTRTQTHRHRRRHRHRGCGTALGYGAANVVVLRWGMVLRMCGTELGYGGTSLEPHKGMELLLPLYGTELEYGARDV
eukprot:1789989-Rhodomonas_salina.1